MSRSADREECGGDPSTWTLGRLQTFIRNAHGRELEIARVVAQGHAYDSADPQEVRRQWAKLSLLANRLMHTDDDGHLERVAQQDFMFRMWVIDRLGPDDTNPDWSLDALAADTLGALTITPAQAASLAGRWRDLAIEQIRLLRRHKNLTAHLETLLGHLTPGRNRDQLSAWTSARRMLP